MNTSGKISFSMSTDTVDYLVQNLTGDPVGGIDGDKISTEEYREHETDTFTHHGVDYNINKVFELSDDIEVTNVDVEKLSWILKYDTVDPVRLKNADYSYPLLVVIENRKYYAVDGLHRLTKAVNDKIKTVPCKIITKEILLKAKVKQE